MAEDPKKERRKYLRYNTKVEIYFDFVYELETKVKFEVISEEEGSDHPQKYAAISRNVSVGGLCFATHKKLGQGDRLHLEVYLPSTRDPIHMRGLVEWCKPVPLSEDAEELSRPDHRTYEVGVRLMDVNGVSVEGSIHHDRVYNVDWSIVLESVFGNYRMLMAGKFKSNADDPKSL